PLAQSTPLVHGVHPGQPGHAPPPQSTATSPMFSSPSKQCAGGPPSIPPSGSTGPASTGPASTLASAPLSNATPPSCPASRASATHWPATHLRPSSHWTSL